MFSIIQPDIGDVLLRTVEIFEPERNISYGSKLECREVWETRDINDILPPQNHLLFIKIDR